MPMVSFDALPDSARIWVFASDRPLRGAPAETMLAAVDRFLADWKAHGVPLRCAREWRDDRFLAVGVDVTEEAASGCSIDGLFRAFQDLQKEIGAQLLGGGRVFYRSPDGIRTAARDEFIDAVKTGAVAPDTPVFDTGLIDAASWRTKFEQRADDGWTKGYFERKSLSS